MANKEIERKIAVIFATDEVIFSKLKNVCICSKNPQN